MHIPLYDLNNLLVDVSTFNEPTENRYGLGDRGLLDKNLLETTLKGSILLNVLAVFGEGSSSDAVELAAGKRGLEHVGRVHSAFAGATGAHEQVHLVDK